MKKRKFLVAFMATAVAAAGAVGFAACDFHEHTYATEWTSAGESGHYHMATCEHKEEHDELKEHVYDDANDTTCNACGYVRIIPVPVTGVTITGSAQTMEADGFVMLAATVAPDNATDKTVNWTSSDPAVATVSAQTGASIAVNGVAVGNVTITATTADGNHSDSFEISVTPITVKSVSLNKTSETLDEGETVQLTATALPTTAANTAIASWESSDSAIASVDNNGLVTANASGEAIITVTTVDGAKKATCVIHVTTAYTVTVKDGESNSVAGVTLIDANNSSNVYTTDSNGQFSLTAYGTVTLAVSGELSEEQHVAYYAAAEPFTLTSDNANPVFTVNKITLNNSALPTNYNAPKTIGAGDYYATVPVVADATTGNDSVGTVYFKLTGASGGTKYVITAYGASAIYNQQDGLRKNSIEEQSSSFSVCLHEGESSVIGLSSSDMNTAHLPYYFYFKVDDTQSLPEEGTTIEYPYLITFGTEINAATSGDFVYAKATFDDSGMYLFTGADMAYRTGSGSFASLPDSSYIVEGIVYYIKATATGGNASFTVSRQLVDGEKRQPIDIIVTEDGGAEQLNTAVIPITYPNSKKGAAERWFSFTASQTKLYTIQAKAENARIEVYTSVDEDYIGYTYDTHRYVINCNAGQTYYLRVTHFTNNGTVNFTFKEGAVGGTQATPFVYSEEDLIDGKLYFNATTEVVYYTFTPSQTGKITFTGTKLYATATSGVSGMTLVVYNNPGWQIGAMIKNNVYAGCYSYAHELHDLSLAANQPLYFSIAMRSGTGTATLEFTPTDEVELTEYKVTVIDKDNNQPMSNTYVQFKVSSTADFYAYRGQTNADGEVIFSSPLTALFVKLEVENKKVRGLENLTSEKNTASFTCANVVAKTPVELDATERAKFNTTAAKASSTVSLTLGTLYSTVTEDNTKNTFFKYTATQAGIYTIEVNATGTGDNANSIGIEILYLNDTKSANQILSGTTDRTDVEAVLTAVGRPVSLIFGDQVSYTTGTMNNRTTKYAHKYVVVDLKADDYIIVSMCNISSSGDLAGGANPFTLEIDYEAVTA